MRRGWAVVLFVVLLAFTWQGFVTQTHVHFDPGVASAGVHASANAPQRKAGQSPSHSPDSCPICREMAQAGHYLLPVAVVVHVPDVEGFWLLVALPSVLALRLRSHAWQSRAPPSQLQA